MNTPRRNHSKDFGHWVPSFRKNWHQQTYIPEQNPRFNPKIKKSKLTLNKRQDKETKPSFSYSQIWTNKEKKESRILQLPFGDHKYSESLTNKWNGRIQQQEKSLKFAPRRAREFNNGNLQPKLKVPFSESLEINCRSQFQMSSVQQQKTKATYTLNLYAKEFVPRNFQSKPSSLAVAPNGEVALYPIRELRQFLSQIAINPGYFERSVEHLTEILNICVHNERTLSAVVDLIFEESVQECNFRYNGARLCDFLSEKLKISETCGSFKQLLLKKCEKENNLLEELVFTTESGSYLRGFALFMAELFSQMKIAGNGELINVIGDALPQIIDTLLSYQSSDNLKCVFQLMKLAGTCLENYERIKTSSTPHLDRILECIKGLENSNECTEDIKRMIMSVVELKASNWGRVPPSSAVTYHEASDVSENEGVLYGPDGKPLSAEVASFMEKNNPVSDTDDYDSDDFCHNEEMDDEMDEFFKLYLQNNELNY